MSFRAACCLNGIPNEICNLILSFVIDNAQTADDILPLATINHAWEDCLLLAARQYQKITRAALLADKPRCEALKRTCRRSKLEAVVHRGQKLHMSRAEINTLLADFSMLKSEAYDCELGRRIIDLRTCTLLSSGSLQEFVEYGVRMCERDGAKYTWLQGIIDTLTRRPSRREEAQVAWAAMVERRIQAGLRKQERGEDPVLCISRTSAWVTVEDLCPDMDDEGFELDEPDVLIDNECED